MQNKKIKIITIIGARPQIIKAAALSRAINNLYKDQIQEIIVHTGQHYDKTMSDIFFTELGIPQPTYNLNIGSASHGVQTALMIEKIEAILLKEKPSAIVIYGDTNSTLASAIAASKIQVPIVHIEAGLRSFDKTMPEEINRILADHVSTLLFCPTTTGYNNLIKEGFSTTLTPHPDFNHPNLYHCGDIMLDNSLYFRPIASQKEEYKQLFGKDFVLCTIHRNTNTDNKEKLTNIFTSLLQIAKNQRIILPLHPRTKKMIPQMIDSSLQEQIFSNKNIEIIDPVGYLEMIYLESECSLVITDSGGVQKEAYFFEKPCIILRPQTEWVEIVSLGAATLADTNQEKILNASTNYLSHPKYQLDTTLFGDGKAAEFMCKTMLEVL